MVSCVAASFKSMDGTSDCGATVIVTAGLSVSLAEPSLDTMLKVAEPVNPVVGV